MLTRPLVSVAHALDARAAEEVMDKRRTVSLRFLALVVLGMSSNILLFRIGVKKLAVTTAHQIESGQSGSTIQLFSDKRVVPPALEPAKFLHCCAKDYERHFEADGNKWEATCYVEQACGNDTLFPFASVEDAELLKKWVPTPSNQRLHRQQCKAAADQVLLEATWCRVNTTTKGLFGSQKTTPEMFYPTGCSKYGMGPGSGPYDRLIVFPSAKLAFCGIPKSGITRWLQFLRFTIGAKDYQDPPYYKQDHQPFYFDVLTPEVKHQVWNDPSWTRAVLIREPSERLLSAYLDKILNNKLYGNVSFAQFIHHLSLPINGTRRQRGLMHDGLGWYTDPHWRPQSFSCGLAQLLPHFHYVGGLDHVGAHSRAILEHVGLWETHGKYFHLSPRSNTTGVVIGTRPPELEPGKATGFQQDTKFLDHHSRRAREKMERYYKPDLLAKVKELYQDDFALWQAIQLAGSKGIVSGKDIAKILDPSCAGVVARLQD